MADVDSMQGVLPTTENESEQAQNIIMAPVPVVPATSALITDSESAPESISETLYIQNLNEKIKTSG